MWTWKRDVDGALFHRECEPQDKDMAEDDIQQ